MDNRHLSQSAEEIMKQDLAEIYIGNLNTVDADLTLPQKGRLGSQFLWKSGETLFISHDGKITRPTYGVGNRTVSLYVTARYQDSQEEKVFEVTVLEEPCETRISDILPVRVKTVIGKKPLLPPIVIVRNDTGIHMTLPVNWDHIDNYEVPGEVIITGTIENIDEKATAEITFIEKEDFDKSTPRKLKASAFHTGEISLKKGSLFFQAQENMVNYLLQVDDNQMLYNFRFVAGISVKGASPMTGWDAPDCKLRGHTTGHYLSSLALAWNVTKNNRLLEKLKYMVMSLDECQNELERKGFHSGFLSAYTEEQFDLLEKYTTYPDIWAPYYTLEKIMTGLYDCYDLAGSSQALSMVLKLGNWVYQRLSKLTQDQRDHMWSMYIAGEFGGMITVLMNLYYCTQKIEYLETAKFFCNEKLFYPMQRNIDTLNGMHANQHIPQIIGALELYKANAGERYFEIASHFWNIVTNSHLYSIGGVGETEMFHAPEKITALITNKTAESCASYNMLKLTAGLFEINPSGNMMDYYELVLYNHILASASHTNDGGTTYFMSLCPGGKKEFNTDENTCCHGTGLESRFRYIQDIYMFNKENQEIYVNLYLASILDSEQIKLEQDTFSDQPNHFVLRIKSEKECTICLRLPAWLKKKFKITICNEACDNEVSPDGYIHIKRHWNIDDTIDIWMEYDFRLIHSSDNRNLVSIAYGPYILAALSEKQEYLTIPALPDIKKRIKANKSPLHFEMDRIKYIPIAEVNQENYHLYFKLENS